MKIVRLTSLLPDMPRLSLLRPSWGMAGDMFTSLLNLFIFSFVLLLAFLFHLPLLLTFLTALLPESRLRSLLITRDLTFLFLSQRPCLAEPEASFPSSAEPRALRSFIFLFSPPSPQLNFSRLPQISHRPPSLVQTKLPIKG